MIWTKVSRVLPVVLAACARVSAADEGADAGPSMPAVQSVEPQPGPVQGDAGFTVHFSTAMDEGELIARTGQSETVVLTSEANVELAAAAIEHPPLSAHERTLLIPAEPRIASDRASITLTPEQTLVAGGLYLLVSPHLKDQSGRRLEGGAGRFAFQVVAPARRPKLVWPVAGGEAPSNLVAVRAFAESGHLALRGPQGEEMASADAHGDVLLGLSSALVAGGRYSLALDGVEEPQQSFTASPCARGQAPALQGGAAMLEVRDTAVVADLALDWPAKVQLLVGDAASGNPCDGECTAVSAYVFCDAKACGPQSFDCKLSLRAEGLKPAHDYVLRVVAQDDLGHESRSPVQKFSTVAPLPRLIISEIMAAPPVPRGEAEYIEILNQGPGAAVLDALALVATDGVVRTLLAVPPPVPVQLAPGGRALAVGSLFNPARYPSLPPGTPILRAKAHRLLGRGLHVDASEPFKLMLEGAVPVELTSYPGKAPQCPPGASVQRDESAPPDADATWSCGPVGGTPGAPP